jgi:uncharacterized protein YjbI with pentapeptide repeats
VVEAVEAWNQWRESNPSVRPDLREAELSHAILGGANLSEAILTEANLSEAILTEANLSKANLLKADLFKAQLGGANLFKADLFKANLEGAILTGANLFKAHLRGGDLSGADLCRANLLMADLTEANLNGADLTEAILTEAILTEANLSGADLSKANLSKANLLEANAARASLVDTNLEGAEMSGCRVYGVSVWNARLDGAKQSNLVITPSDEPDIQVDNLEVAQFVYLLLSNAKIRHIIDTITSKVVLILGRFTPERKIVLDTIREELRKRDYAPILFDFEKPSSRDITETVRTLAHMARFVIADITDAKSIPQELIAIVPNLPSVPVQPLLLSSQHEYGMFDHLRRFPWVLEPLLYENQDALLMELELRVIAPAEAKAKELTRK